MNHLRGTSRSPSELNVRSSMFQVQRFNLFQDSKLTLNVELKYLGSLHLDHHYQK